MSIEDDSGFTMAEFIIVVGLVAIILTAAYAAFTAVQTEDSSLEVQSTLSNTVDNTLNQMTREMRQAQEIQVGYGAFAVAQPQTVSFYSNVDQDLAPELITYYVSNGALYKQISQPQLTAYPYNFVAATATVVIPQVNTSYAGPTFTYYTNATSPVSTTTTSAISAVDVVLTGKKSSMTGPVNVRAESWVKVRSLFSSLN